MKTLRLFSVVLVILLLLSLAGFAGAQDTSPATVRTWDISFDGYCDGLNVTFDNATGIAYGSTAATCASCPGTDPVAGTAGHIAGQGQGLTLSYQSYFGAYPMWFYSVIRKDHTWTLYNFDGTVFNSGTWSFCPGTKAPEGARPAGSR
jgi:hypothetical protein